MDVSKSPIYALCAANSVFQKVLTHTVILFVGLSPFAAHATDVLTEHNDNARTGANLAETQLKSSNVNTRQFGKLFERFVDGQIYGQPLLVSGVTTKSGVRNVVYVATMHDSVFAFDADDPSATAPLWVQHLETPRASTDNDIQNEIGITSTPVISKIHNAIYVVTYGDSTGTLRHQLFALSLCDGTPLFGSPRAIDPTAAGAGAGSSGGVIAFDASHQNQRPALLLSNDTIYVGFASFGDHDDWHGWMVGFSATDLSPLPTVFVTTPNGRRGGIWQAGQGPAADAVGNVYFITGNGDFGPNASSASAQINLGDSFVKLGANLSLLDWFSPWDSAQMDAGPTCFLFCGNEDEDLGAGGLVLMPADGSTFVIGGGKRGKLYVLNPNNLGHQCATCGGSTGGLDTQIVDSWQATPPRNAPPPALPTAAHANGLHHIHGTPVFWNSPVLGPMIYLGGEADNIRAFHFNGAGFDHSRAHPGITSVSTTPPGSMPGAMISISANNSLSGSGILWATHPISGDANQGTVAGMLRAFDATTLQELWNSTLDPSLVDRLGDCSKFSPPTIANGKVYVATFSNKLAVYGLKP